MADNPIPPDVLDFLDGTITSIDQLEILLLLHARRDRAWTAVDVAAELRSNSEAAADRLGSLQSAGLLAHEASGYRFAPRDTATDRLVSRVAAAYRDYRLRVIERVFKKPDGLRSFTDAFRLRKEPK